MWALLAGRVGLGAWPGAQGARGAPRYPGAVTSKELAQELGLSRDALKRRLALLRQMGLDGWARAAPGGALELPPEVVDVLRRAISYERAGLTVAEALRRARTEVQGEAPRAPNPAPREPHGGQALVWATWALAGAVAFVGAALWALVVILAKR